VAGKNARWFSLSGKEFGSSTNLKKKITIGPSSSIPRYIIYTI